jgi:hypothetical protein
MEISIYGSIYVYIFVCDGVLAMAFHKTYIHVHALGLKKKDQKP